MVAAYVRVSTEQQDLEAQKTAILRAASARGDVIDCWFEEKISGKKLARPELNRLRAGVRAGEHRKLYVFALDRLSRGGIADTFRVVDELRRNGCAIASVSDPFDLDGPAGDVIAAVMAWAAQQELRRLGERISAARRRVEAAGGRWGRPRRIDPGTLAKARVLQAGGASVRKIAAVLKIPRATLHDALSEKGHYGYGRSAGSK
jgi:DNA invertase Pin-like site-specific DNA recombinase